MKNRGIEDGDVCNRNGCTGHMTIDQEPCYCSATSNPPCSNCEHSWVECDYCGFIVDKDDEEDGIDPYDTAMGILK